MGKALKGKAIAAAIALAAILALWNFGANPVGGLRVSLEASAAYGRPLALVEDGSGWRGGGIDTRWEASYTLRDGEGVQFGMSSPFLADGVLYSDYGRSWFEAHRADYVALSEGLSHVRAAESLGLGDGDDGQQGISYPLVVEVDSPEGIGEAARYLLSLQERGMPRISGAARVHGHPASDLGITVGVYLEGCAEHPLAEASWAERADRIRAIDAYGGGSLVAGELDVGADGLRDLDEGEVADLLRGAYAALVREGVVEGELTDADGAPAPLRIGRISLDGAPVTGNGDLAVSALYSDGGVGPDGGSAAYWRRREGVEGGYVLLEDDLFGGWGGRPAESDLLARMVGARGGEVVDLGFDRVAWTVGGRTWTMALDADLWTENDSDKRAARAFTCSDGSEGALARPVLDSGLYTYTDEHAYLTLSDFGLLFGCDVRVDELAGVVECST